MYPQPDRLLTAGDGLWREIFVLMFHWMVDGQVSIEWADQEWSGKEAKKDETPGGIRRTEDM